MRAIPLMTVLLCVVLAVIGPGLCGANLLPNGGFEVDSTGDGVPDGWLADPLNFTRETLEEVQAYIRDFPSHEDLLKQEVITAADGWVLARREPEQDWPDFYRLDSHYQRFAPEYLPQASRFGQLPVPGGLELGGTTLAVHNRLPSPRQQVVSEPIPVKPDTGYRLSYWFRTSHGAQTVMFQIIDAEADRNAAWPPDGVVSGISLGWAWVPQWTRYEIPFRTGPAQTAIRLRPWIYFGPDTDGRRLWYDDFRLVEDDSVAVGDLSDPVNPEPLWPAEALEKGFAVAPRPELPVTHHTYLPTNLEIGSPLRLRLAAGETGSGVIFVRSLGEEMTLRAAPGSLVSEAGYGIANGYGARSIYLRAAEDSRLSLDMQRFMVRPTYLLHSAELALEPNAGGQFWLTVEVPPGTPPGRYHGEVTITRVGGAEAKLPVVLTVRDLDLLESNVAFGTWYHTAPQAGPQGPSYVLPGSDEVFLADQRRHGMNTVAAYGTAERLDSEGNPQVSFNELEAMVQNVQRAGLCTDQPLVLLTWGATGIGGAFGHLVGGGPAVREIYNHARESGWPEVLFTVFDEPSGGREGLEEAMEYYTPLRRQGIRTVTAGPGEHQRHWYDVWIQSMYSPKWPEWHEAARQHNAEVWMYDCALTGRNPLYERFYAGLWTWRTGVKGNMVWSYGWYVRINESGLPESKTAWEGRLAGVNDYRYLHTLETLLASAQEAGQDSRRAVQAASAFLEQLRDRVPVDAYAAKPQGPDIALWNPLSDLAPEDYDRIREECARHITALQRLLR